MSDSNYPAGVTNADFAAEDAPCGLCDHLADDHDPEEGCSVCGCPAYHPPEDPRA